LGTSGWSDKALVAAGWYPRGVHTPEQRLRYYAEQFSFVEVNSTYYGLPAEATARAWAERTPASFTFNVKAFSLLTHHQTRTAMLPPDLRPRDRTSLRQRDLTPPALDALWDRYLQGLAPLRDAGKLGLLLFQFPPSFHPGPRARDYLLECRQRSAGMRICVEFRDPAWLTEAERPVTMDFLTRNDIPYVCVDTPQGQPGSVPPVLAVTSAEAVVRMHGRSPLWTTGNKEERYHYRYNTSELSEWAERIRQLSGQAEITYVAMNNCVGDDAQVNAAQLATLLNEKATAGR
ncbi:MAG: DUF72 domain-containing protein, partial [Kibdelosporangium sp.]